ncbi:DUF3261 domain-containing protein [Pseudomonas sp. M30-35]|uniref:DUF3261 domain-containing protein n=1 Tax=Pseudomonas sp. M30-35 TaxID=1981174 RepID=UPI000B3C4060|nr:DUF3261 domain-containing protein [Pseudomonas sp. M30-35]ARU90806.1 hypothetical protein B9K09_20005 [Pseudomonas sp. M30-35]
MVRSLILGLCLLLGACAARTPVPPVPLVTPQLQSQLPLTLQIQRQAEASEEVWLLVIQAQGSTLRWSLFDPMGTPLARQQLVAGTWHDEGLLPPNPAARELFAALLFALSTTSSIAQNYPAQSWQIISDTQRTLSPNWRIDYSKPLDFTLEAGGLTRYHVTQIVSRENP